MKTKQGSWLPLDIDPSSEGNVLMEAGVAVVYPKHVAARYDGEKFVSHFATCPNAAQHRRKA